MKYDEFKMYAGSTPESCEEWEDTEQGMLSYGEIRPKIFYRIVSIRDHQPLIDRCPHIRFFDMAITFRWLVHENEDGISSALIEYDHLEYWGISEEEIIQTAVRNTPRLFPAQRCRILDIIRQWLDLGGPDLPLYVLTNSRGINGASVMFYKDILKEFGEEIDQDFYILPSSIHEVLLIGKEEVKDPKDLAQIVLEANQTVVSKEEFLSNQVFYFDRSKGEILIANL